MRYFITDYYIKKPPCVVALLLCFVTKLLPESTPPLKCMAEEHHKDIKRGKGEEEKTLKKNADHSRLMKRTNNMCFTSFDEGKQGC